MKNKLVNMYAGGGGAGLADDVKVNAKGGVPLSRRENERCAFTMAEILLSLTIIGVVAAITLPSLTGNINERTWNTQRKALYARISQAIALMPALNGYGTLTEGNESTSAVDTAAETFVTEGLSKVLKINNICDSEHLADCGIPSTITTATGVNNLTVDKLKTFKDYNPMFGSISWSNQSFNFGKNIKSAAFETQNGESILVYYNPQCNGDMTWYNGMQLQYKVCANFVYDLNGNKGPNTFGKDIGFITAFYPSDSVVVAPFPVQRASTINASQVSLETAKSYCRNDFDNARVPNREELMAMSANAPLFGRENTTVGFHSSTIYDETRNWHVHYATGQIYASPKTAAAVWCIKR